MTRTSIRTSTGLAAMAANDPRRFLGAGDSTATIRPLPSPSPYKLAATACKASPVLVSRRTFCWEAAIAPEAGPGVDPRTIEAVDARSAAVVIVIERGGQTVVVLTGAIFSLYL